MHAQATGSEHGTRMYICPKYIVAFDVPLVFGCEYKKKLKF